MAWEVSSGHEVTEPPTQPWLSYTPKCVSCRV